MNTLDIILAIPLAWGAMRGFYKGFIDEAASFFALIIAVVGGFKLTYLFTELITNTFQIKSQWIPLIAFLTVFVLLISLVKVLSNAIHKLLAAVRLGFINNIAGAALGLLKVGFVVSLLVWLVSKVHFISDELQRSSILYAYMLDFAPTTMRIVTKIIPFTSNLVDAINQLFDKMITK